MSHPQSSRFLAIVITSFALLASGCPGPTDPENGLKTLRVTPQTARVALGETTDLLAIGTYAEGTDENVTDLMIWTSSDESIATVSMDFGSEGQVTALAAGTVTITAEDPETGLKSTAAIEVATLDRITLSTTGGGALVLPVGTSVVIRATGVFSDGQSRDITESCDWSATSSAVTVSDSAPNQGAVTGAAPGTFTVRASLSGLTGEISGVVTPATLTEVVIAPTAPSVAVSLSTQLTATGRFSDGSLHDVTERVTWSSSDEAVATVGDALNVRGKLTGIATGTAQITATDSDTGESATVTATTTAATLQSVRIDAPQTAGLLGASWQLRLMGRYSDGTESDLSPNADWSSDQPEIFGVLTRPQTGAGTVEALAQGRATITATLDSGESAQVTLEAFFANIASLTVSARDVGFRVTEQFTATGTLSNGTSVDLTSAVTWSSSDESALTVSNAQGTRGRASASTVAATGIVVTARFGAFAGTATVQTGCFLPSAGGFGGSGTTADPFLICTESQIVTSMVAYRNVPAEFKLMRSMAGITGPNHPDYVFSGVFDGNGFTVPLGPSGAPFFRNLVGGTIKNTVFIVSSNLLPPAQADWGPIVAFMSDSTIENVTVRSTGSPAQQVAGTIANLGGVVGRALRSAFRRVTVKDLRLVVGSTTGSVGGLVGQAVGGGASPLLEISDCAVERIRFEGAPSQAGGFIGSASGVSMSRSYAVVDGTAISTSSKGGLIGFVPGGVASITSSYWSPETSGLSAGIGAGATGGTGVTAAEMRMQSTYSGWDFINVWSIDEGVGFPQLR
jgi:uncharacterized protein YjdB